MVPSSISIYVLPSWITSAMGEISPGLFIRFNNTALSQKMSCTMGTSAFDQF